MPEDLAGVEQRGEALVGGSQMIYPHRCIDEDHPRLIRRRGMGLRSGMLPPSRANRRAASRSIKAFSASRIRAGFSFIPV